MSDFAQPGRISIWIEAIRPATLWAAVVPVCAAAALVQTRTDVNLSTFLCILATACLIQIGTNFVNDYKDAETGADNEERMGDKEERGDQGAHVAPAC